MHFGRLLRIDAVAGPDEKPQDQRKQQADQSLNGGDRAFRVGDMFGWERMLQQDAEQAAGESFVLFNQYWPSFARRAGPVGGLVKRRPERVSAAGPSNAPTRTRREDDSQMAPQAIDIAQSRLGNEDPPPRDQSPLPSWLIFAVATSSIMPRSVWGTGIGVQALSPSMKKTRPPSLPSTLASAALSP